MDVYTAGSDVDVHVDGWVGCWSWRACVDTHLKTVLSYHTNTIPLRVWTSMVVFWQGYPIVDRESCSDVIDDLCGVYGLMGWSPSWSVVLTRRAFVRICVYLPHRRFKIMVKIP